MRFAIALLILGLLAFGCVQVTALGDIKANPDKYVGKEVTVKGNITSSIKLGQLSGFNLEDGTGTIGVKSDTLPPVGSETTVKGTVVKDTVFGYYILASDVSWKK